MIPSISTLYGTLRQRSPKELFVKGIRLWRRSGWRGIIRWIRTFENYRKWVRKFDTLSDNDRRAIAAKIAVLEHQPLISVLMPTYNTPEKWLRHAIESVRAQIYTHWELCIADDASNEPHVKAIIEEYADLDKRIRTIFRDQNGHISAASNSSLEIASGEYVALLDHDDELPEHALYMVVAAINEKPYLDLIYSDEDKINKLGRRFDPYFKPDWNPDLLTAQNMVSHLGVYRTELVRQVGGFREGYEGAQDWDLALRVSDAIPVDHIHHIPHVLYHWRSIKGSTATSSAEKPYATQAAIAAVQDYLDRNRKPARAELSNGKYLRVRYDVPKPLPLVSIIIPTRNGLDLLRRCIDSVRNQSTYTNFEIIVIDNQSDDPDTLAYLSSLEQNGIVKTIQYNKPFNFSAINNFAVKFAEGDLLCFMNNDIEVISSDWIQEMVSHAIRQEIGVVGAMLYYPNNTIQHAGVIVGMGGVAGHNYLGSPRGEAGYMERACLIQNLSVVTAACMLVRKDIYLEVGGMDENNLPVAFNDVDFCLRVLKKGYRNLWTPYAEFYHHESATRGADDTPEKKQRFHREIDYMISRWQDLITNDPAYNPNLTLKKNWPYLALAPRTTKPW